MPKLYLFNTRLHLILNFIGYLHVLQPKKSGIDLQLPLKELIEPEGPK